MASGERGAADHPAADLHPLVAAIAAEPTDTARAVAALRWLADWAVSEEWRTSPLMLADNLHGMVEQIEYTR